MHVHGAKLPFPICRAFDDAVASEAEVVDFVREAREANAPFEIVGGRHPARAAGKPMGDLPMLDVSGLKRHREISAGRTDFDRQARHAPGRNQRRAGAKRTNVWDSIRRTGALFGAHGRATLGGAVSCRRQRPRGGLRHGAARDSLLGFRAVNGFGEAFGGGQQSGEECHRL